MQGARVILRAVKNDAGLKCWKLCVMRVANGGPCFVGMWSRPSCDGRAEFGEVIAVTADFGGGVRRTDSELLF